MRLSSLALPLALVVPVASLTWAPRADACVSGIVSAESLVTTDSQLAFISVHENTSDIAVLLTVPAAGEDFGALIPLPSPSEPVIDENAVDAAAFAGLDVATRPIFEDFSGDGGGEGGLFSCGGRALAGDALKANDRGGVIAGEAINVGPVTAQWLVADDATALATYLTDNGFALPEGGQAVVDTYIGEGNGFLAFKRNDAAITTEATAIGVHFSLPGDLRTLPLRIAKLGAPSILPVTVFVAAPTAVGTQAPWSSVHVEDLDDKAALDDYAALVDERTAEAGGKLWIFEGSLSKDLLEASQLTAFIDDGATISRLSARIPSDQLDDDAAFTAEAPAISQAASASAFALPKKATLDVAFLGLVGATLLARRKKKA